MKKTIIINIHGIIFNIDEDAFDKLQSYLNELSGYFSKIPEGKEIIEDIEARISELMQPRITDTRQSIYLEDIIEIIGILGSPQDIAGSSEENTGENQETHETGASRKINRRLYRDPDNGVLGGICSGLGAYFNMDPVFFRIVFLLLIISGVSIILYFILWIAIPVASTTSQKLEMRGESITISNLERALRDEYTRVKQNFKRIEPHSIWIRFRNLVKIIIHLIGRIFRVFWYFIKFLLGNVLIIGSVFLIVALISTVYFNTFFIHDHVFHNFSSLKDYLQYIVNPVMEQFLLILALIIIFVPLAIFIYAGLKLLIRFRVSDKWPMFSLAVLWIISIITFISLLFNEINRFKKEDTIKEVITLNTVKPKMLYINVTYPPDMEYSQKEFNQNFMVIERENTKILVGNIQIDIEKTPNNVPEIEMIKTARGITKEEAEIAAKSIRVIFTQNDSVININPVFTILNSKQWKFQTVHFVLRLPVNMKLFLNNNTRASLSNVQNVSDLWPGDLVAHPLQMTERGLEIISFSNATISTPEISTNKIINIQIRDHYPVSQDQWDKLSNSKEYGVISVDNRRMHYGIIDFDIRKSEGSGIRIEVIKTASGLSESEARTSIATITYSYEQKDSVLWFDPIFLFPADNKCNDQHVKVILRLPIHSRIFLSKDLEFFTRNIENLHFDYQGDRRQWKMTNDGLSIDAEEKNEQ